MIVPFVLDPGAVHPGGEVDGATIATHERFLMSWDTLGVLVFPGAEWRSCEVAIAFRDLPIALRKRWTTVAKLARRRPGPPGWSGLSAVPVPDSLLPLGGQAQLACLETGKASRLGLSSTDLSRRLAQPDIEITRFDCLDRAEAFLRAQDLANEDIAAGTPVDDVWRLRLAGLAACSTTVVVVDAHCGKHLTERGRPRGLVRLLRYLASLPKPPGVRIYTGAESDMMISSIERGFRDRVAERGLDGTRCKLVVCDQAEFRIHMHDRYVRFDRTVCRIGEGLSVLDGDQDGCVRRLSQFSVARSSKEHLGLEERLRDRAKVLMTASEA